MEEFVRKLALWHTKTFKPIMTHEELEPIMATLGFVALPATCGWKEYVFSAGGQNPMVCEPLPRIRLPFPRIDGLHIFTYRAFFDAVSFYLAKRDISDHFHVRGMPLHRSHDLHFEKKFRRMNDEEGLYVYRDGTLDQATALAYSNNSHNSTGNSDNSSATSNISSTSSNNGISSNAGTMGHFVPLKDLII